MVGCGYRRLSKWRIEINIGQVVIDGGRSGGQNGDRWPGHIVPDGHIFFT